MTEINRDTIKTLDRKRRIMRDVFASDAKQAQQNLHPRTIIARWKNRKRHQFAAIVDTGKQRVTNNAPMIGLASTAILLFAARKPILRLYHQLRKMPQQSED